MKNKMVSYSFDSGLSSVTIQNRYGHFHGASKCNSDETETMSAYAGQRYAETRAAANFAKFRYNQEKIKLKTIKNLLKAINYDSKSQDEIMSLNNHSAILRQIKLKLRDYSQSVEDWHNLQVFLEQSVATQAKERDKILSRAKKIN